MSSRIPITSQQIRPPSGDAFWPFRAETLAKSGIEIGGLPVVTWKGREWIWKEERRTIYEVVGYQIASVMGLPIQPWLAFEHPGQLSTGAGMLIELLPDAIGPYYIFHPPAFGQGTERVLARALAMCVFKRPEGEWPDWFLSDDKTNLRLLDLDGICPSLSLTRPQIKIRYYRENTRSAYAEMKEQSVALGISHAFDAEMDRLLKLDFSSVVDLSGHSKSTIVKRTIVRALRIRQREVISLKALRSPLLT